MVVTAPAQEWPPNGPRPINLKQDVPQVAELLELAFGEKMDREGRSGFDTSGQPAFLWRLNPQYSRLAPGICVAGKRPYCRQCHPHCYQDHWAAHHRQRRPFTPITAVVGSLGG